LFLFTPTIGNAMTEQRHHEVLSEAISALADNQTSELELQRILKASEQDSNIQATWARYHLIGTALRSEPIALPLPSFAANISAAIAAEYPLSRESSHKTTQGLWYQLGRAALVASVAGGVILGVQQFNGGSLTGVPSGAAQMAANQTPLQAPVAPSISLPSSIERPPLNTRNVSVQSGYPQNNHRVMFQPNRSTSVTGNVVRMTDEDFVNYINQMLQVQAQDSSVNSNTVVPFHRVIMTEKK
jgi:sigma-E factor negative regulatory protein RseA